jgi:hypothetical protein
MKHFQPSFKMLDKMFLLLILQILKTEFQLINHSFSHLNIINSLYQGWKHLATFINNYNCDSSIGSIRLFLH